VKIGFYGETPVGPEEFEEMAAGAVMRLQQDLDEARLWAKEFRRIAEAIWSDDYDSDDIDKVFDKWLALPEWFKDQSEQR
jgi:hypothetical protein